MGATRDYSPPKVAESVQGGEGEFLELWRLLLEAPSPWSIVLAVLSLNLRFVDRFLRVTPSAEHLPSGQLQTARDEMVIGSIGLSTNIIPVDTSTRISRFGAFGKLNRPQHIRAPSSFISPHCPRLSLVTVASHAPRARMSPQRPPQTNPLVLPLPHRPYEPSHRPWRGRRAHFRYAAMSSASSRRLWSVSQLVYYILHSRRLW